MFGFGKPISTVVGYTKYVAKINLSIYPNQKKKKNQSINLYVVNTCYKKIRKTLEKGKEKDNMSI